MSELQTYVDELAREVCDAGDALEIVDGEEDGELSIWIVNACGAWEVAYGDLKAVWAGLDAWAGLRRRKAAAQSQHKRRVAGLTVRQL